MRFTSEKELFGTALKSTYITELFNKNHAVSLIEPKGLFGVPDLVIGFVDPVKYQIESIAFEMKLSNWKRALIQGFRYRAFATHSYVLMDAAFVHRALAHKDRFRNAGVGLMSISRDSKVTVHVESGTETPYAGYIEAKLKRRILQEASTQTELGEAKIKVCYYL